MKECIHCKEEVKNKVDDFCCLGCEAAYKIINKLGFKNYYNLREVNPEVRKIKPEIIDEFDVTKFANSSPQNIHSVSLVVQGLHCAACVWLIESILKRQYNVTLARINLSKKTLTLEWKGDIEDGNKLVNLIQEIGYKLLPFDEKIIKAEEKKYNNSILIALAVAGFGAGNVMLFSVALWFSNIEEMGQQTRNLFNLFSSLIALPVIVFSARPFFTSAYKSIKRGFPNMDLAISLAISLTCIVSLVKTFRGAEHVYFDSAVMLIFFLLIGRYLDLKARKKAFAIASEFNLLAANFATIEDGAKIKILPTKDLKKDMIILVAVGEKIAADGIILEGDSELDTSLITGESAPKKVTKNSEVFAGTINIAEPLKILITKSPKNSLLSEIIKLGEEIENKKNSYIRIADKLAKFYIPTVHLLAFSTFCLWFFILNNSWEFSLTNAIAVLIITCPCALALAIPIVQTIVISNFVKKGILVKSGEALEKFREIEVVVFDKTGSLTKGEPSLTDIFLLTKDSPILLKEAEIYIYLSIAASVAKNSKHPISRAITKSFNGELENLSAKEYQGLGLSTNFQEKTLKIGRREFCDIKNLEAFAQIKQKNSLKLFMKFGEEELVFLFNDELKKDTKEVVKLLKRNSKKIILLSGDEKNAVKEVANELNISEFYFEKTPVSKVEFLQNLKDKNQKFIMVGDGLNDAPSLALADISISFSKASDISQNIADIVIQGRKLMPIINLFSSSNKAILLMKQNLIIALIYNIIAVPFAVFGYIVPLFAAIAMSLSSLIVLLNSLRMNKFK